MIVNIWPKNAVVLNKVAHELKKKRKKSVEWGITSYTCCAPRTGAPLPEARLQWQFPWPRKECEGSLCGAARRRWRGRPSAPISGPRKFSDKYKEIVAHLPLKASIFLKLVQKDDSEVYFSLQEKEEDVKLNKRKYQVNRSKQWKKRTTYHYFAGPLLIQQHTRARIHPI